MTAMPTSDFARRVCRTLVLAAGFAAVAGLAGCRSGKPVVSDAPNPALRPLTVPANATLADEDRAALTRFIGVWDFEGWSTTDAGQRQNARGTAAAASEHGHFVLVEVRSTVGELSGRAGSTSGSMLLASEPGKGLTLTAWGDAAPAVRRLSGTVHGNGSVIALREPGCGAMLTLTFETDDRWVAELHEADAPRDAAVARYVFSRRAN